MKTRVILVDDHALTLIGMRYLLSAYDDLRIVAQAQDADGLLAQLEAHPCDLLITDLMMPGSRQADGLRLVQKVGGAIRTCRSSSSPCSATRHSFHPCSSWAFTAW